MDLSFDLIRSVRDVVAANTRRTPLFKSEWLSNVTGSHVFLKCENLQVTGSFKARGAVAALSIERPASVVAVSAGNHGQGLARAARRLGIPCTVVVPSGIPDVKARAIEGYGARLVKSPFPGYDDTETWMKERASELGGLMVSPYDHPAVMAGNGGTLGLEILEEAHDLDSIVVPCGGGGCAIGLGVAAGWVSPDTRIIGVNTDASPGMWLSRRDGKAHLRIESQPTLAEGLEGGVSENSYRLGLKYIHDVVCVKEASLGQSVRETAIREHLIVEGSGAAGAAALLEGLKPGKRVCVVLTGGNIEPHVLAELLRPPIQR